MGTPLSESTVHYAADGNARAPFHTWISLHNPTDEGSDVVVALHLDDGSMRERVLHVAPRACALLDASQLGDVDGHTFAIDVAADGQVVVLRTVAWDDEPACIAGGPRLRLAGTWQRTGNHESEHGACLAIENVGDAPAMAEVEHLTSSTRTRHTVLVPPHTTRAVRDGRRSDAIQVVSTSRYFAGGETGRGAETILTLTNDATRPATVDVRYLPETLAPVLRRHVIAARARITIVAGEDARFRQAESFGMHVRSVDGVPVDVERSTWWSASAADGWAEGEGCDGATSTGSSFELPATAGAVAEAVVLMANPGEAPVRAKVFAVNDAGAAETIADVTIPGGRLQRARLTLRQLPDPARATSIRIVCDDDARIVVERAADPRELGPGAPCRCVGLPATRLR